MAFHNETRGRKRARALIARTGHHFGKFGGHLSAHADEMRDKAMITEAVHQHERHEHPGKGLTRLKLADGGVAGGPMASQSASKTPRGKGKGAAKNHIAIVISPQAGQGAGAAPPRPVPVPVPGPGAGAPPPMPPRPMPPPGGMPPMGGAPMGGAPMGAGPGMPPPGLPMRKHGGRARRDPKIAREAREEGESYEHELREHEHRARGGRTGKHGHAESLASHMPGAADDYGEHEPIKIQRPEQELETAEGQHRGGRTHRARGGEVGPGRVPNMRAGAGSGEGRLEKSGDLAYCGGGRA